MKADFFYKSRLVAFVDGGDAGVGGGAGRIADRLQVYRQSLGEMPLGLLELASSATRPTGMLRDVAETADGGFKPPRLVAAGDPRECVPPTVPALLTPV